MSLRVLLAILERIKERRTLLAVEQMIDAGDDLQRVALKSKGLEFR